MSRVELQGVSKRFGLVEVLQNIDLDIAHGEFVVFVGPSGCGKSTLLRLICGLEPISGGQVLIDGKPMRGVPPAKRGVAMVFQSYALYPHMTVAANMGFSLRMAGVSLREREERVRKAAAILQLDSLLHRLPKELSGGQRQRVAIGRAIVREPGVFLFDEPLSNLDAELRVQMRLELTKLHRQLGTTMVFVTHDQVEAMTLANRIVVLRGGRVEQIGAPVELYERPVNRFVAGFIGAPKMNFLNARIAGVSGARVRLSIDGLADLLELPLAPGRIAEGDAVTLGIRPEHLRVGSVGAASLSVNIEFAEQLGSVSHLHAPNHPAGPLVVWHEGGGDLTGQRLDVSFDPSRCHIFSSSGDAISR
ncbi:MAG TPA: ABC transporter ATP-binding protein [Dongiaceae bacterium]|jgi:ABC-type sugar transport system ATPase subunit